MNTNRRDFLRGTAWMGVMAAVAGCKLNRLGFGDGGVMQGFALPPMKRVRVAFVGIGGRGTAAVHRVSMIPGMEIVALCDKNQERIDENLAWLKSRGWRGLRTFCGETGWQKLCDWCGADVIYVATPWHLHAPIALAAMRAGKVPLVEVASALTVDECWELVETSESLRIPCMQLENCCYGEIELLTHNMVCLGVLGELVHGEGGYIHDLRYVTRSGVEGEGQWRYQENLEHKGNRYPTHGLVPMMQHFDINRGDAFDFLVSLESDQFNWDFYMKNVLPKGDPRLKDHKIEMGDMNTTLLRTKRGKSIVVQHDVSSPRPYSRIQLVTGTRGAISDYPFRVAFEEKVGDGLHGWFKEGPTAEIKAKYMHPLWRQVGEIGKKVGGHGGMDFVMDLRWAYCLQNGLPLDMDVYDLATSSCLCELTETSVRAGSRPVTVPDFTRGGWRTAKPLGVVEIDMSKMDLKNVGVDEAALNV